ncbi:MAG: hypothetical protein N2Z81_04280 [Hydrogenothermaceae bacterium]|nr:hypothetical protein [Hydrogenothermaceae bacterium]
MYDRYLLTVYILTVFLITSIHNIGFYLIVFLFFSIFSLKDLYRLLKKSIFSILLFNSVVSISYIFINGFDKDYLLLINLRVIVLTYITFFITSKINLFKALSFSKTLTTLLVLSYSQILTYKKLFEEFNMALTTRAVKELKFSDYLNFYGKVFEFFFDKSTKNVKDISDGMRSRGFFND